MAVAGACMATPSLGQVEPDLGHRWRYSVGSGATANDAANAVTILRIGDDPDPPEQLAGTVVAVGDTGIGSGQQAAWITFDNGTPDGSLAAPISGERDTFSWGGATSGEASALDVAHAPLWVRSETHSYVVGWFDGTVDFGGQLERTAQSGTSAPDAYLGFYTRAGVEWIARISGPEGVVAHGVATSSKCGPDVNGGDGPGEPAEWGGVRQYGCGYGVDFVAVCGGFEEASGLVDIEFYDHDDEQLDADVCPTRYEADSNGLEDAFVAIYTEGHPSGSCMGCNGGLMKGRLSIGGEGNDSATAVAIDQVDQAIIVTGYFSDAVDFDPDGTGHIAVSEGGTDIFVARYLIEATGCFAAFELKLDWVYTYGSEDDDEGMGVALDAAGDVYAVGYHRTGGDRDMFVAKIGREQASTDAVATWDFNISSQQPGDQFAADVAVDGLGRVLVTGRFGCSHPLFCVDQGHKFDFDPTTGTDIRSSSGGGDAFVARYFADSGTYDGAFTFGGSKHDVGTGIAVDPVYTQTVAHTGYFGAPDAGTSGYTVDLDPDSSAAATVESSGKQDGFVNLLRQDWQTNGLKSMVAIVLDSSQFVNETDPPTPENEFAIMRDSYANIMDGTVKIPSGVLSVPHDGSVAVAVFLHSLPGNYIAGPGDLSPEAYATQVIPWTVLDGGGIAGVLGDQMRRLPRWLAENPRLDDGLLVAEESITNWPRADSACFRSIHVLTRLPNDQDRTDSTGDMAAAKAAVIGSSVVERIDGFGIPKHVSDYRIAVGQPQTAREYLWDHMVASDDGIEVAAQTSIASYPGFDDPDFANLVSRLLNQVAYCPGDFDLDGDVDMMDYTTFLDAHDNPPHPDYERADWNFDGTQNQMDIDLFEAAHALGCCP